MVETSIMRDDIGLRKTFNLQGNKKLNLNRALQPNVQLKRIIDYVGKQLGDKLIDQLAEAIGIWTTVRSQHDLRDHTLYNLDKMETVKDGDFENIYGSNIKLENLVFISLTADEATLPDTIGRPVKDILLVMNFAEGSANALKQAEFSFRNPNYLINGKHYDRLVQVNARPFIAVGKIIKSFMEVDLSAPKMELVMQHYTEVANKQSANGLLPTGITVADSVTQQLYDGLYILYHKRIYSSKVHVADYSVVNAVLSYLIRQYDKDINLLLTDNYIKETNHRYAKAYEDKKGATKKVKQVAQSSSLLQLYNYLELDNDTDLTKFKQVEQLMISRSRYLPTTIKPQLRFRKLGNYRASGVYFGAVDCICVDIRHTDSWVHEYGHHIDFTKSKGHPLSLSPDFYPILTSYQQAFTKKMSGKVTTSKLNYYIAPPEVFARAFELYYSHHGFEGTPFVKSDSTYNSAPEYVAFNADTRQAILSYFDNLS